MSFQDFHNLQEAFDKPYNFSIDSSNADVGQITYIFRVDDAEEQLSIEAVFEDNDPLSNYIQPRIDYTSGKSQMIPHKDTVAEIDRYIASKYPTALKPITARVIEYAFYDRETRDMVKTGRGGYNTPRIIGTVIHIAQHYIITRAPNVIHFTGAKDENRGSLYTKLTNLAFRSLQNTSLEGYGFHIDEHRDNTRYWIYNNNTVPYFQDRMFQDSLLSAWKVTMVGSYPPLDERNT